MGYLRLRRLSKILIVLVTVTFFTVCCCLFAEESLRARSIADRVNVRVRPDINSEIVTQLSLGEEVVVLEKNEEPRPSAEGRGEWTRIKAPIHSKCWVYGECVEGARIKTDSVNLRCGPGIAFPVLAKLKKGTPINIIEVFGEWVRVEPPVGFGVWVSSKYMEYEPQIVQIKPEAPQILEEKEEEVPMRVDVEEKVSGVRLVSFAGRLEDLGIIINRPGTYKLVGDKGKWLCIIKSPTLDVNPYVNRVVRIEGVVISKSSSWGVPVIELKRLSVIR